MRRANIVVAAAILITAIAAIAVSAVYVNDGGDGNAPALSPADGRSAGTADQARPRTGRLAAFVVHDEPKPVADVSFETAEGEVLSLTQWRGKAVLLNLWATWCAPCRHEMPALDRLQARLGGDRFEVVAVSLDRAGIDKPKKFFEDIGIRHLELYIDKTARLGSSLAAVGMPTTLLIDAEGREVGRIAGPAEWDTDAAVALIEGALGGAS